MFERSIVIIFFQAAWSAPQVYNRQLASRDHVFSTCTCAYLWIMHAEGGGAVTAASVAVSLYHVVVRYGKA